MLYIFVHFQKRILFLSTVSPWELELKFPSNFTLLLLLAGKLCPGAPPAIGVKISAKLFFYVFAVLLVALHFLA